jgi:SAM-dependent methyltransferase
VRAKRHFGNSFFQNNVHKAASFFLKYETMQLGKLIINALASNFRAPGSGIRGWISMRMMKKLNADKSVDAIRTAFGESLPNKVWLELGPGHGFATEYILNYKQPSKVHGVDISEAFRSGLRAKFVAEIENGRFEIHDKDANNLSFADGGSIDYLFGLNVLYFLDPLTEYLTEFHRVLAPDGRMAFGVSDAAIDLNKSYFVNTDWQLCRGLMEEAGFLDVVVGDERQAGKDNQTYRIITARKGLE